MRFLSCPGPCRSHLFLCCCSIWEYSTHTVAHVCTLIRYGGLSFFEVSMSLCFFWEVAQKLLERLNVMERTPGEFFPGERSFVHRLGQSGFLPPVASRLFWQRLSFYPRPHTRAEQGHPTGGSHSGPLPRPSFPSAHASQAVVVGRSWKSSL